MTSALSPREIQSRLRAGASIAEVAADAGVEVERISGFALPVMAERAHVTRTALAASVRRRGDGSGHRRLGDLIHERLQARGLDADSVEWDSWRQGDLRWRLVGLMYDQAASRAAEFVYDTKGRFSVADNADARWMIGEELPSAIDDPDNENTIDFHDEFALVRATSDGSTSGTPSMGRPGDDVPRVDSPYEGSAHTSELDELYDMLSGVSEDSVRIYLGLEDGDDERSSETAVAEADEVSTTPTDDVSAAEEAVDDDAEVSNSSPRQDADEIREADTTEPRSGDATENQPGAQFAEASSEHTELSANSDEDIADPDDVAQQEPTDSASRTVSESDQSPVEAEQDPLVPDGPASPPKRKPARKRASIPSWDEIMFGGPSRS